MITHRLAEVFALSDRIVVLRNGTVVGRLETKKTKCGDLVHLMVGDAVEAASTYYQRTSDAGVDRTALQAEVSVWPGVPPVRFTLHQGEVLGLGGLSKRGRDRSEFEIGYEAWAGERC
jgi:ABC-type sugar transport system ATPase subunit